MPDEEPIIPVWIVCPWCGQVLDLIEDEPLRAAVLWGYVASKRHEKEAGHGRNEGRQGGA